MSVNPFDLKTIVLAKHAQHVVLIHFPIALFLAGVAFDFLAQQTKRRGLAEAAYFNFLVAAHFDSAGSRDRHSRLAVRTRGAKIKRHAARAFGFRVRVDSDDLAGVVGALPQPAADSTSSTLSVGGRISSFCDGHADSALGWLPERSERAWLIQYSELGFTRVLLLKLKDGLLKGRETWKEFDGCPVIGGADKDSASSD